MSNSGIRDICRHIVLTFARTCYFAIVAHLWWVAPPPRLVCPLTAIELRNKNERKVRNIVNLTVTDCTTLGQILISPGQSNKKSCFLIKSTYLYRSGQMPWPDEWPRWVILHISRCVLTRQAQWHITHDSTSILCEVIDKNIFVTCNDVIWPVRGHRLAVIRESLPSCSWIVMDS